MNPETPPLLDDLDRHLRERKRDSALDAMRRLFARLEALDYKLGYRAATVVFNASEGRGVLSDLIRENFKAPPFMWLGDERECVLLQVDATFEGDVSFRSRGVGEFCVEVYHARPDGTYVAIERDDFCLK